MNSLYKLIVFDWEGTLSDTLFQFINAIVSEAKKLNFCDCSFDEAKSVITYGPVLAVKKLFPNLSLMQQSEILEAAQKAMITNAAHVTLAQGALNLLHDLKEQGFKLAIATNRGRQSLLRDLNDSGLLSLFDVIRTASDAPAKPAPQMLFEIMNECFVEPNETLMIGDSVSDLEMSQQANVKFIGVDFYHQNEQILKFAGAEEIFDSFDNLRSRII